MATMKFYNVNVPPTAASPEGTYYVKRVDNADRIDTYVVSNGAVKKQENNDENIAQIGREINQIPTDILPTKIFENDFSENTNGFASLFGSLSLANGMLSVGDENNSCGLQIKTDIFTDKEFYVAVFDINIGDIPAVRFQWGWGGSEAKILQDITLSGRYEIPFQATLSEGGVYKQPIFYGLGVKGAVLFDNFQIYKKEELSYFTTYDATEDIKKINKELSGISPLLSNDFSTNLNGVTAFNGGVLLIEDERLKVQIPTAGSKGFQITAPNIGMVKGQNYEIIFDLDLNDQPSVVFYDYWAHAVKTITASGRQAFSFIWSQNTSAYSNPILAADSVGSFYIDNITIKQSSGYAMEGDIPVVDFVDNTKTKLGKDAVVNSNGGTAVGSSSEVSQLNGTAIGFRSKAVSDTSFGCITGNEIVAVGEQSKGFGWRTTAIGAKAHAAGQSSTAVGSGAEATQSHSVAFGRGSVCRDANGCSFGGIGNTVLNMGSSSGHRHRLPMSGIGTGFYNPNTHEGVVIRGIEAYDYRPYYWGDKPSYSRFEELVYTDGMLYISQVNNNTYAPTPGQNDANWRIVYILGLTSYAPTTQATVVPIAWTSVGAVGRGYSYNGHYYVRIYNSGINTPPDVNPDWVNVDVSFVSTTIRASFFVRWGSTSYNTGQIVYLWERLWIAKKDGVTSAPPVDQSENSDWHVFAPNQWNGIDFFMHFDTRFIKNENGGNINIDGGRAIGNGKGGVVNFRTAPTANPGSGNRNNLVVAGRFDSESDVPTRFLLLDLTTGTLKRVSFGDANSGGTGYKVLRVEN